jgi:hypothetical protein
MLSFSKKSKKSPYHNFFGVFDPKRMNLGIFMSFYVYIT